MLACRRPPIHAMHDALPSHRSLTSHREGRGEWTCSPRARSRLLVRQAGAQQGCGGPPARRPAYADLHSQGADLLAASEPQRRSALRSGTGLQGTVCMASAGDDRNGRRGSSQGRAPRPEGVGARGQCLGGGPGSWKQVVACRVGLISASVAVAMDAQARVGSLEG